MRVTQDPFGIDDLARIEDENLRDADRAEEDAAANRDLAEAVEKQDRAMAKRMTEAAWRYSEIAAILRSERAFATEAELAEVRAEYEEGVRRG